MSKYQVKIYSGDYGERQKAANADGAICYAEHHFNASSDPKANVSFCVVADNASEVSKAWARHYSQCISSMFNTKLGGPNKDGCWVGGYEGRGNGNLNRTAMPAILCEPLLMTSLGHQTYLLHENGITLLAQCLVDSIQYMFPEGGLVAFSIGHLGKRSSPKDKGVHVHGVGYEADFAKKVIDKAKAMLEEIG